MTSQVPHITTTGRLRQDAAKKRRKYLGKKTGFTALSFLSGALGLFCMCLSVAMFELSSGKIYPVECFRIAIATGIIAGVSGCVWAFCSKKAKSIPYVPPVAKQIAALPASDILVRGSEEPAATSGELLRAAGQALEPEELLRPMKGKTA